MSEAGSKLLRLALATRGYHFYSAERWTYSTFSAELLGCHILDIDLVGIGWLCGFLLSQHRPQATELQLKKKWKQCCALCY